MNARELMTPNPACCTPETPLQQVARMMVDCDCGEIPVVEREDFKKLVGVVTDRDIACRAVAAGRDPLTLTAADVMSSPAVTASEREDLEELVRLMETHRIRRIPIVDQNGQVCGIISQADVARRAARKDTGELVRELSSPTA